MNPGPCPNFTRWPLSLVALNASFALKAPPAPERPCFGCHRLHAKETPDRSDVVQAGFAGSGQRRAAPRVEVLHTGGVFIFDRDILDALPRADRHVEFIRESLLDLNAQLQRLGLKNGVTNVSLLLRHDRAASALPAPCQRSPGLHWGKTIPCPSCNTPRRARTLQRYAVVKKQGLNLLLF